MLFTSVAIFTFCCFSGAFFILFKGWMQLRQKQRRTPIIIVISEEWGEGRLIDENTLDMKLLTTNREV